MLIFEGSIAYEVSLGDIDLVRNSSRQLIGEVIIDSDDVLAWVKETLVKKAVVIPSRKELASPKFFVGVTIVLDDHTLLEVAVWKSQKIYLEDWKKTWEEDNDEKIVVEKKRL